MTVLIQLGKKTALSKTSEEVQNEVKNGVGKALTMGLWQMKDHDAFVPRVVPKTVEELDEVCSFACQRFHDLNDGEIPDACEKVEMRSSNEIIQCKLPKQLTINSSRKNNAILLDTYNALMIESSGTSGSKGIWNEQDIFKITDPKKPTYNPFDIPMTENFNHKKYERDHWKKEQEKFIKHPKKLVYTISDPYYFFERFGEDIASDLKESIYDEVSYDCLLAKCKGFTNEPITRTINVPN